MSRPLIEHLLRTLEEGDIRKSRDLFEKFSQRYPQDKEFHKIYWELKSVFPLINDKELTKIKKNLERLRDARGLTNNYSFIPPLR